MFKDWRYTCQNEYLKCKTFVYAKVNTINHEHCEFCFKKYMSSDIENAYITIDGNWIVCEQCYIDFKLLLEFKTFEKTNFDGLFFSDVLQKESSEMVCGKRIYYLSNTISLLENLIGVNFKAEKLTFIPCLKSYADKEGTIEELEEYKFEIEISKNINEVIDVFKELKESLNDKLKYYNVLGLLFVSSQRGF